MALADKIAFRNCLVAMCPRTLKADLPSAYDVKVYIEKQFMTQISKLKAAITVSTYLLVDKEQFDVCDRQHQGKCRRLPTAGLLIRQRKGSWE